MSAKRIVLAEYFTRAEATLLFIVREDFTEPYVQEIYMPLDDLRRSVGTSYGLIERKLNWDDCKSNLNHLLNPSYNGRMRGISSGLYHTMPSTISLYTPLK